MTVSVQPKLLFVCGSRGEWGYIRPLLRRCESRGIQYSICATNMLLIPEYGALVEEIRRDGFVVEDELIMSFEGNNHYTMAKSLGVFLCSFIDSLLRVKPDWVVIAGDRGEQLMAAIGGAYCYVPVAHIQAGERSGNIDGVARHAIGKFAHLHFASNEDAADRLRRLGEEEFRIHNVGAPQLDELVEGRFSTREELEARYSMDLSQPYLLVVQHPVTEDFERAESQVEELAAALNEIAAPKIWILPNNDAGAGTVRKAVLQHRKSSIKLFPNLTRADFLGFLKRTSCLVGNSSAGLLEAPTFGVPAVNIGRRQNDRVQGQNVLNCNYARDEIVSAIQRALSMDFKKLLEKGNNPYGDGRSSERILDVLERIRPDDELLVKRLTY